jgi:hypothetical protein
MVSKHLHKSNVAKVEENKKQKLLEEALDDEGIDAIEEGVYYSTYIDEWSEIK